MTNRQLMLAHMNINLIRKVLFVECNGDHFVVERGNPYMEQLLDIGHEASVRAANAESKKKREQRYQEFLKLKNEFEPNSYE